MARARAFPRYRRGRAQPEYELADTGVFDKARFFYAVIAYTRAATHDLLRSRIRIKSLNFMRGRTFLKKFLIIDEAQNLSPHQIKTLVTRAGPGSKTVCLGNIAQIDTPYLTESTSGLTYVADRFTKWDHSGHITLQRGARSRLADCESQLHKFP